MNTEEFDNDNEVEDSDDQEETYDQEEPDISIVIPVLDEEERINEIVQHLRDQDGGDTEVGLFDSAHAFVDPLAPSLVSLARLAALSSHVAPSWSCACSCSCPCSCAHLAALQRFARIGLTTQ